MKKLGLALCFALLGLAPAQSQPVTNPTNGVAGAYNSVAPTCTNGVFCWLQVDVNGNLKIAGTVTTSLAGTTSNASSAVATSATNIPTVSYNYGFNGTTWDQLQVDTAKNLLVSSGGAPNLTIAQVSIATSDTLAIAARTARRSVTIQQITGTQNVFCNQTTATAANGVVLPAVVGASFTFNTTSAIRCIAITGAQTVAVAETF